MEVKDEAGKVAPSRKVLNTKPKVFILLANKRVLVTSNEWKTGSGRCRQRRNISES